MKTIYNGSGATVTLYWKIMRGENKVTEDLSNLKSRVFLIGSCNTYSMEPDVVTDEEFGNKVLKVEVDASMLSTGVYDVKAVWEKNDGRNIMKSARTGVFAITDNSEEVGEIKSEEVIRIASYVESIGRDGLSAYEIAVIRGLNNGLSENDWVGNEAGRIIAEQGRVEAEETREENETKRKDAEDDRRDAFETFMSTSATDFENAQRDRKSAFDAAQEDRETTFEDKLDDFDERFSEAEAERNDGEATRNNNYAAAEEGRDAKYDAAEAARYSKYNTAEGERNSTIQGKLEYIEERFTEAEKGRKSTFNTNENNRQANEEKRIQAEGDRKKSFEDNEGRREQTFQDNEARRENTFLGNEDTREQNEQIRQAQESVRQQAEQIRIDTFDENERGRIATFNANEAARIAAESERNQNEAQREANEAIRQESYKDKLPTSAVVQETGDGENVVMSQKAVSGKLTELESKEVLREIYNPNVGWSNVSFIQLNLGYKSGGKIYNAIYLKRADGSNYMTVLERSYSSFEDAFADINVGIHQYGDFYVFFGKNIDKPIVVSIRDYYDISDLEFSPTISDIINKRTLQDIKAKEYVREIYAPKAVLDNVDHIDINFLQKAGSRYYNSMYLRDSEEGLVQSIYEFGYDTIDEAIAALGSGIIIQGDTHILLTGTIPSKTQNLKLWNFADYRKIDNAPIIKDKLYGGGITNDAPFNYFIKELYASQITIADIEGITLNVAKYIGGKYYNSLYLRTSEKTIVIFDENFPTLDEAIKSFTGIKGGGNGYALITNETKASVQYSYAVQFNHPLTLEYAPSIKLYLNPNGSPLIGKKIVWEGDSIMADNTYNATGWRKRIENQYGMVGVNYSRGGSTFTANLDGLDTAYNMALRVDSIVAANPSIDYFILDGGTNDADRLGRIVQYKDGQKHYERQSSLITAFGSWSDFDFSGNYDKNTFCGAVEYVFWKLKTSYPNVKIGMIIAPKMGLAQSLSYVNRWEYFAEIIKLCKKWGIPYIDLWNNSLMNPNIPNQYNSELDVQGNADAGSWYLDGQHPAPLGYDYSSKLIAEWMEKL